MFMLRRSLGALIAVVTLWFILQQNDGEGYSYLYAALGFEALFLYILHRPLPVSFLRIFTHPKQFVLGFSVVAFVALAWTGYYFDAEIPGSFIAWLLLWAVTIQRVYFDYVVVAERKEKLIHVWLPALVAAAAVVAIQRNNPDSFDKSLIVLFFMVREVVDWGYDLVRWLMAPKKPIDRK